jgi:hypothetical protein
MAGYANKSLPLFSNYWHCCRNLSDRWIGCFDTVAVRVASYNFLRNVTCLYIWWLPCINREFLLCASI